MAFEILRFVLTLIYSQFFYTPPRPTRSLAGKTVIVTGANAGLGLEAVRHIVRLGASTVILAVRNVSKGETAKSDIIQSTSCNPSVLQVWELDLASYKSVISFAERAASLPRLDVVLANAGINTRYFKMAEDNESSITVNVVSTFLMSLLLLPKLKETAHKFNIRPVLTIVSSEVHFLAPLPNHQGPGIFDTLNDATKADMSSRYPVSKLLEVFVVRQWAEENPASNYPVSINYINPGFCVSELAREMNTNLAFKIFERLFARTTEVGSRTLVDAITQGPESHGQYLTDCHVAPPASSVLSNQGRMVQRRVWEELKDKLEKIRPGVTANL